MALTWDDKSRKDHAGKVVSVNYEAQVPNWGEASVHAYIHRPGELYLDCLGLGIEMYSLGKVALLDALKQQAEWCLEAMVDIGTPGDP